MKTLIVRERNMWFLDWNNEYSLKIVFAKRFVKNGWTHIKFKGKVIEPKVSYGLYKMPNVYFKMKVEEKDLENVKEKI